MSSLSKNQLSNIHPHHAEYVEKVLENEITKSSKYTDKLDIIGEVSNEISNKTFVDKLISIDKNFVDNKHSATSSDKVSSPSVMSHTSTK